MWPVNQRRPGTGWRRTRSAGGPPAPPRGRRESRYASAPTSRTASSPTRSPPLTTSRSIRRPIPTSTPSQPSFSTASASFSIFLFSLPLPTVLKSSAREIKPRLLYGRDLVDRQNDFQPMETRHVEHYCRL